MDSDRHPPLAAGFLVGDTTGFIRGYLDYSLNKKDHESCVYYFAIVASACLFESVLEDYTYLWCSGKRNSEDPFLQRLMIKIGNDVNRATGLEKWKEWLRVLFDVDLPKVVGAEWDALHNLFALRNQLAHGRTTKFMQFWNATNGRFVGMSMEKSSYRLPVEHLFKAKVVSLATGEVPSPELLFRYEVARYFRDVVETALRKLSQQTSLSGLHHSSDNGSE